MAHANIHGVFHYNVFLSRSSKDKPVVRPMAEQLRKDELRLWFNESVLRPGDSIPAKTDPPSLKSYGETRKALEQSRVFSLPIGWERAPEGRVRAACRPTRSSRTGRSRSHTINHRATCPPLNRERRFIPRRIDDSYLVQTDLL